MAVKPQAMHNRSVPNLRLDSSDNIFDDDDKTELLLEELRNIQSMIKLTKRNLEALNARFSEYQHPPSVYITESEDLTSKLNEFQNQEQKLLEQIAGCDGRDFPDYHDDSDENTLYNDAFLSGITSNSQKIDTDGIAADTSPRISLRSPLKSVVRVLLPNQQCVTVHVRPGQTVNEALFKTMRRCKLAPDMCVVYRYEGKARVNWNDDISTLEGEDILVEIRERTTSRSHNFVRKTFFTLAYCECCRHLLIHGFRCETCGYRFHKRCANGVPTLCRPLRVENNRYRHLLAMNAVMNAQQQSQGYRTLPNEYFYLLSPAASPPQAVP